MIERLLNKIEGLIGSDLIVYLMCNGEVSSKLLIGDMGPDSDGIDQFWLAPKENDFLYYYNLDDPLNPNSISIVGLTDECLITRCKWGGPFYFIFFKFHDEWMTYNNSVTIAYKHYFDRRKKLENLA